MNACFFRHLRAAGWWVALLSLAAGLPLRGQVQIVTHNEIPGVQGGATAPFLAKPGWAFLPVELELSNSTKDTHRWVFSTNRRSFGGDSMTIASRLTAVAQPGVKSRTAGLVVLGGGSYGYGYQQSRLARVGGGGSSSSSALTEDESRHVGGLLPLATPGLNLGPAFRWQTVEASKLPSDWRAYCGIDRIALKDSAWRALSPGARTALRQWLRLGGSLLVQDEGGGALDGFPVAEGGGEGLHCSFGRVERAVAVADPRQEPAWMKSPKLIWAASRMAEGAVSDWPAAQERMTGGTSRGVSWMMALVVLGFAILAGPVNLFLLAPAKRRHRLFFTTPLISLAAGALLVVAVVLVDGIGGKGERVVWLESAPDENTSYLRQHQVSRCGAMFATGFEIPESAYFEPLFRGRESFSGSFEVDVLPDRIEARGPWFSSRRAQAFYLAAARPGRGRVELGGAPERPVLTSAFDFPLERCFFLGADGRTWWQCAGLKPGTATPLAPATAAEARDALLEAVAAAPPGYREFMERAMSRPGSFVALATAIPAIKTHAGIKWQTTGIVAGPAVTP